MELLLTIFKVNFIDNLLHIGFVLVDFRVCKKIVRLDVTSFFTYKHLEHFLALSVMLQSTQGLFPIITFVVIYSENA